MAQTNLFPKLAAALEVVRDADVTRLRAELRTFPVTKIIEMYGSTGYMRREYSLTKAQASKDWSDDREGLISLCVSRYEKHISKDLYKELDKLDAASNAADFDRALITVEWKKSSMYGHNPTAEASVGTTDTHMESQYIGKAGGCGYDKLSTAIGDALCQSPAVIKLFYTAKEQTPTASNESVFTYGMSSGMLPCLSYGVGVSAYESIFNRLGFSFRKTADGKMFDIFEIKRFTEEEKEKRANR